MPEFFAWLMHVQYLNLAAGTREPGSKIVPICRPVNVIEPLGLHEERHLQFVLKRDYRNGARITVRPDLNPGGHTLRVLAHSRQQIVKWFPFINFHDAQ